MSIVRALAFLTVTAAATAAMPANMTGTWELNVAKSKWGTRPKPISVTIHITHTDPALAWSGVVVYEGNTTRPFEFTGAVDGRQYPMERSFGAGTATVRRVDASTVRTVFNTADGNNVETTEITVSHDGKMLTRTMRLRSPEGNFASTEVYDRK